MKVLIFFEFIHRFVICLMVGDEVKGNLGLQQTRWPALSTLSESSCFEPSVAVIVLPIAFLSFLCLTGLLFSWCLCPTRPWFIRKVDNTIHEINRYLLDCAIRFAILLITKYLLDSVIHPLNNWIQEYKQIREIITRTYLNAGWVKSHRGEGGTYVDYDKLRVILFKPLNLPNPE